MGVVMRQLGASEFTRTFARIAALSFGGPAGQIAMMHRILVDEKRWIGEARFLHALNYCMLLPGPEAQQLAIYIGWLLKRTRGGLLAGSLFVLPGMIAIMALSFVYVLLGHTPAVAGLFFGLKAAVLAIVLQAVVRIGSRSLRTRFMIGLAVVSFGAIFLLNVPFPIIVFVAGAMGWIAGRRGWSVIRAGKGHSAAKEPLADVDMRAEVDQERLTGIDRSLLKSADDARLVTTNARDTFEQALRAGRLQKLARLGLATPNHDGSWRLADDMEGR
jgi:chromate transporter